MSTIKWATLSGRFPQIELCRCSSIVYLEPGWSLEEFILVAVIAEDLIFRAWMEPGGVYPSSGDSRGPSVEKFSVGIGDQLTTTTFIF